jgi:hypothetical protein
LLFNIPQMVYSVYSKEPDRLIQKKNAKNVTVT